MKKTCANCDNYISTLPIKDEFHIHDYCVAWESEIPSAYILSKSDNLLNSDGLVFDDIETGQAFCHCYEPVKGSPAYSEELMEYRKKLNLEK